MLQLNYVRNRLTIALLGIYKPKANQLASIGGSIQGEQKFRAKPTREISFGENHSITVPAEAIRCCEVRSYKGSSVLLTPEAFEYSAWRRAVNKLPDTYQAWIRYCYGDSILFPDQIVLCHHVWSAFLVYQREIGAPKMSKKIKTLMQSLVWLSVQESKLITNRGVGKYDATALSTLSGLSAPNWNQNYQFRWFALLQIGAALDREALTHVEQAHRAEDSRESSICGYASLSLSAGNA